MQCGEELINKWYSVYREYFVQHLNGKVEDVDQMWADRTAYLIKYYEDLSARKKDLSFERFLIGYIDEFERLNDDYRRNKRIDVTVKGTGGRYLP